MLGVQGWDGRPLKDGWETGAAPSPPLCLSVCLCIGGHVGHPYGGVRRETQCSTWCRARTACWESSPGSFEFFLTLHAIALLESLKVTSGSCGPFLLSPPCQGCQSPRLQSSSQRSPESGTPLTPAHRGQEVTCVRI